MSNLGSATLDETSIQAIALWRRQGNRINALVIIEWASCLFWIWIKAGRAQDEYATQPTSSAPEKTEYDDLPPPVNSSCDHHMVANGLFSSAYDKSIYTIFTRLTWIVMFRFC